VVLVAQHIIVDLADRGRGIMPCLVAEMRVGGDRIDLDAHLLEGRVDVGEVLQFRRANEGEVGGVEKEHAPFAAHFGIGHIDELAFLVRGRRERFKLTTNIGHSRLLV